MVFHLPARILIAIVTFLFISGMTRAEGLTRFDQLLEIMRNNNVRSIEELLPLLPRSYIEDYLLVYESHSAQHANVFPAAPRVILFGKHAQLLMAFTKNPHDEPVVNIPDTLETIEFNEQQSRFIFRQLTFSPGTDPLSQPITENPARCLACHGAQPRPLFNIGNVWPGFFGSIEGQFCETIHQGTNEMRYWLDFNANARHQGRYQFLPPPVAAIAGCPQSGPLELTVTNGNADYTRRYELSPNAHLQHYLGNYWAPANTRRIIKSSPLYPKFQYLLTAMAKDCDNLSDPEGYFPPHYAHDHGLRTFAEIEAFFEQTAPQQFAARVAQFEVNNATTEGTSRQPKNFVTLPMHAVPFKRLMLVADRMRLDMRLWSTDIDGKFNHYMESVLRDWTVEEANQRYSCDQLQQLSVQSF